MLKRSLLGILVFTGLSVSALAQQPLQDPSGFSTRVPNGFKITQNEQGSVVVDPAQSYMVVVKSHGYANFEAFAADANLQKDGFRLVGDVQTINGTDRSFRAAKTTAEGNLIADTFVSFSPYGGGSVIVAISNDRSAEAAYYSAFNMASQVQFQQPQENLWARALRGKHLLFLYTASGFSERIDIYLRDDGSFVYRSNSSSLSQNGSGSAAGNADGRWGVSAQGQLQLQFNNGRLNTYTISRRQANNEIGLNGKRYFVMNQ